MPKVPKQPIKKAFARNHKTTRISDAAITAVGFVVNFEQQIYLDYILFVKRLTKKAEEIAIENKDPIIEGDYFKEAAEVRNGDEVIKGRLC